MDVGPFCDENPAQPHPYMYDLSAILVHKGSLASSGHYIAHIREASTGLWWKFDDETVGCLGAHPLGVATASADRGRKAAEGRDAKGRKRKSGKPSESEGSGDEVWDVREEEKEEEEEAGVAAQDPNLLSSADAYMLLYTRRVGAEDSGGEGEEKTTKSAPVLPPYLRSYVDQKNKEVAEGVERYRAEKEAEEQRVDRRRKRIRSVLAEAPVFGHADESCFVATAWLRSWADDEDEP